MPFKMAEILNRYGIKTYYISLAERRLGHDSTLFHYGSEHKDWNLSYIFSDSLSSLKEIARLLSQIKRKYNITHCFATGSLSYLLKQAGITYKYWSYGSDLDQQCFAPIFSADYPFWKRYCYFLYFLFKIRNKQRKSIRYADTVMISPYQIEAYNKICPKKKLFFLPHFIKTVDYQLLVQQKAENKKRICKEIQAKHFFFSSVRHVWTGYLKDESDNKSNDIILNSFAMHVKTTGGYDSKLVLVEKGSDVEASKSLARNLKIDKYIVWVNEMRREELEKYYQGATMCFGQFGTPVLTFAAIEPLSNATPCVSFFKEEGLNVPFYKEMPPALNNRNPNDITEFMSKLLADNNYYENLCYKSWQWVRNNCSEEKFVESFVKLFENLV